VGRNDFDAASHVTRLRVFLKFGKALFGILSMKNLLLFFLFVISLCAFGADDVSYDWVIEQYKNNDSPIDDHYVKGRIDGEEYVAIVANRTSPTANDGPIILVFRKTAGQFDVIAKVDLQGDYSQMYSIAIKNNSLFLEHWVGHHGWHGGRYQFKQINRKFRLIGEEHRSQSLGCYAGDESPACSEYEVSWGMSYNFRTSSALHWKETINLPNENRLKEATRRLYKWLQPKGGSRRQMKCHPIDLPLLDGFDIDSFSEPKCH
jgi:hypothetical protein